MWSYYGYPELLLFYTVTVSSQKTLVLIFTMMMTPLVCFHGYQCVEVLGWPKGLFSIFCTMALVVLNYL